MLTVVLTGYLHGNLVNRMNDKLGTKKSLLVLLVSTCGFTVVSIIFTVFGPKTENLMFIYIAYFLIICTVVFKEHIL